MEHIQKMMNGCSLDADSQLQIDGSDAMVIDEGSNSVELNWHGQVLGDWGDQSFVRDGTVQEILWELYELNFHSELLGLNCTMARFKYTDDARRLDRQAQLARCFHGGDDPEFFFFRPLLSSANKGLSANTIQERAPYIMNLARVLSNWNFKEPYQFADAATLDASLLTVDEAYKLEQKVAKCYCHCFYNKRGHALLTPHCSKLPED